ncbi:hypothetical protein ONZ51_g8633 [Trametes cubensis]|uniref:Uncharacterized protein n=1 Tax=Trametes cubensis TaxID=1111947 RepID=A0AAD7TMV4_9APHY|nr:hypothetical protein ONZ51_g8633 [Trametes cubensis]
MLIRVRPAYSQADIVFSFHMPDPMHDDTKPCPPAWRIQLDTLESLHEREGLTLEYPKDIHALDKAAWHSALVNEVVFDAVRRVIICTFIDGFSVSWPMVATGREARCLASLDDVASAVRRYTRGEQPGRKWVADSSVATTPDVPSVAQTETSSVSSCSQRSKHRRQRSFLGSIVSAFKGILPDNIGRNSGPILPSSLPPLKIPSHSHSRTSSTFSRTQVSPPTSPTVAERQFPPPFTPVNRPRESLQPPKDYVPPEPHQMLRRYARSLMLDIVREFVYPMFSMTGTPSFVDGMHTIEWAAQVGGFPPGMYPAWAARSMLRQTEERLREMVAEANARGLGHVLACGAVAPAASLERSSRDSDSDDTTSASTSASATSLATETDGSSVHTPVDSPVSSPFVPASSSLPQLSYAEAKSPPQVPRSPSPPGYDLDVSTYHALTTLRSRLFNVLSRLSSTPRQIHNLHQGMRYGSDLTVLEIKSRRRAWSCRDFVGGASLSLLGLSTPVHSSPLARCEPVTAESLARAEAESLQELGRVRLSCLPDDGAEFGIPGACVGVKVTTKELDSRLFPLSEEDEDEEDEDEPRSRYQSGYGFDEYVEDEEWRSRVDYDLESGLLAFPRPEPVGVPPSSPYTFPHSNSHPMVRPRTRSMLTEHPRLPPSSLSEPHALSHSGEGGLSPDSLLCQPLNVKVPVPVMLGDGESIVDGPSAGSEFTLAMDLPSPFSPAPRGWVGDNPATVRTRR